MRSGLVQIEQLWSIERLRIGGCLSRSITSQNPNQNPNPNFSIRLSPHLPCYIILPSLSPFRRRMEVGNQLSTLRLFLYFVAIDFILVSEGKKMGFSKFRGGEWGTTEIMGNLHLIVQWCNPFIHLGDLMPSILYIYLISFNLCFTEFLSPFFLKIVVA
jgi:hypothetical protein